MMARCGCMSFVHPAWRWGCEWSPVKLLNPASRSGSGTSPSQCAALRSTPATTVLFCSSAARRPPPSKVRALPKGVAVIRAQQQILHASSCITSKKQRVLNDEQKAAVETTEKRVRVVAGPGSGKTLVLTHRIAHLIENQDVHPSCILCLTFTNKAKNELQQRLGKLLGGHSPKLTTGTFHGICVRILRETASKEEIGIDGDFVIYDEQDSQRVVKSILSQKVEEEAIDTESERKDDFSKRDDNGGLHLKKVPNGILEQRVVESTRQVKKVVTAAAAAGERGDESSSPGRKKKKPSVPSQLVQKTLQDIAQIKELKLKEFVAKRSGRGEEKFEFPASLQRALPEYDSYQKRLRSFNAADFDDLIMLAVRVLCLREEVLRRYQTRWSHVLADEFQDTDWAQFVLLRLLCGPLQKLFVVGDVDQAIYGWRGADYKHMEDLQKHFRGLATFELRRNYRSSPAILKLASEIISQSYRPTGSLKPLKLQAMESRGPPVTVTECLDSDAEVSYVFENIRSLVDRKRASYRSFGVLYRTRAQGQVYEAKCVAMQIPYRISGSTNLLSRKEIKDLRAYLQLIWNPEDGVALDHVINTPPRGLGPGTLRRVQEWASSLKASVPQALQKIFREKTTHKELGITSKARSSLLQFCQLQEDLRKLSEDSSVSQLIQEVYDRTEMSEFHKRLDEDSARRTHNVRLFRGSAYSMENEHGRGRPALCSFLEAVALNADPAENGGDEKGPDSVQLSTLHAAKGLEFDYVFIVGAEEGILPLSNSDPEEERRLFYVGVTRARKKLFITSRKRIMVPGEGFRNARPSHFLSTPSTLYKKEPAVNYSLGTLAPSSRWS